jgi:hypothetical protein
MATKRTNAKHSEVLSGATFHAANNERGAKTQARVYEGSGHRVKVAQRNKKWGVWVWPKHAKNCKRKNPAAGAVEMREAFTGLPSTKETIVKENIHVHEHLAALGELVSMRVKTVKGVIYDIDFGKQENPKKDVTTKIKGWVDRRGKALTGTVKYLYDYWINPKTNPNRAPLLCVTEDGENLHIVGPGQKLDLKALGLSEFDKKESIIIGDIKNIDYFATKDWKDGKKPESARFTHRFNEETGGPYPKLRFDSRNSRLFIDGGLYRIKKPLFGQTSPGIEN